MNFLLGYLFIVTGCRVSSALINFYFQFLLPMGRDIKALQISMNRLFGYFAVFQRWRVTPSLDEMSIRLCLLLPGEISLLKILMNSLFGYFVDSWGSKLFRGFNKRLLGCLANAQGCHVSPDCDELSIWLFFRCPRIFSLWA